MRSKALAVVALLTTSILAPACSEMRAPVEAAIELRIRQIYDAGEWLQRVPVELAVSLFARSKLEGFVDELGLPETVGARVRERIRADDFVDELVPFLLFLREMYQVPEGPGAETFDDHLRARFAPSDGIPGMEHDMFRWAPEAGGASAAAAPTVTPELLRPLVSFYDVLFLQDAPGASGVEQRLACESRLEPDALRAATRRASPSIHELLEALGDRLGEQAEVAAVVRGVLEDESRLEAATAALIRFIDQTVCRNYRFFAARAFRARQLEAWLLAELDAPGGGALWSYLEHAQHTRRFGGVVVVDGLQGRLLESLARGRADDPFLRTILAEQARAGGPAPTARRLRSPDPQQTEFVAAMGASGFSHPSYLPFFRQRLQDPRTHWVPVGLSSTPTISVRNIPIALTGAPVAGPSSTGLPNFHFVDREFARGGEQRGRAYYFFGSDAVELVGIAERAGMQTLFARLPHLGGLSCTAQYDEAAQFGIDALLSLGLGEKLRDFGERLCAVELERRSANERELQTLRRRLLEKRPTLERGRGIWERLFAAGEDPERALAESWIREIAELEQRTLPELFVAYNPWPDHFAHFEGPFADEILAPSGELNRLDYWLGRFLRAYEEAGVLDRTVFGMAGDHGLAPVFHLLNPEVEVFDALRGEGTDFRVEKISSDEGEGPKLTNPFEPPSMKGIDVVVASTAGGNYMLDLFVDQGAAFARQPLARELRALRPLAQPGAEPIDLLSEVTTRLADSLDYLVVREEPCSPEGGTVRIMGHRDGRLAEGWIRREDDRLHYRFEGADLLGLAERSPYETFDDAARARHDALRAECLGADPENQGSWCSVARWRELSSYTKRPDAVVQLGHLYDSDLAGTVNLFPREGVGYNSVVPGRHAGESFHEKNAFVALWGRPLAPRREATALRSASNAALPIAVYEHLTGERPAWGEDGWGELPLPTDWLPGRAGAGTGE